MLKTKEIESPWFHPFASTEEYYFDEWVKEMTKSGYINKCVEQPGPYTLVQESKVSFLKKFKRKEDEIIDKKVLNDLKYTPDKKIIFTDKFYEDFGHLCEDIHEEPWENKNPVFVTSNGVWFVDVKGTGSRFNDGKYFSVIQKIFLEIWCSYAQKVVISNCIKSFFVKTFTPKRYLKTDAETKNRTIHYDSIRNLNDWVTTDAKGSSYGKA